MRNNQWEMLDIITLIGFIAQLDNMEKDTIHQDYIHNVIDNISLEIDKLHKENDMIINEINKIKKLIVDYQGFLKEGS